MWLIYETLEECVEEQNKVVVNMDFPEGATTTSWDEPRQLEDGRWAFTKPEERFMTEVTYDDEAPTILEQTPNEGDETPVNGGDVPLG